MWNVGGGFGIGSTIMPSMAAAFQTLSREETPRATTAINAIQRIAGGIGRALLAIVLQRQIAANIPSLDGGIQAVAAVSGRPTPLVADAFATSLWVAVSLIAAGLVPALLLPSLRSRQERPASPSRARGLPA